MEHLMRKIISTTLLIFSLCTFSASAISAQIYSRRNADRHVNAVVHRHAKQTQKTYHRKVRTYRHHTATTASKNRRHYSKHTNHNGVHRNNRHNVYMHKRSNVRVHQYRGIHRYNRHPARRFH